LQQRAAVVTGAAQGIGRALSLRLALDGAAVAIVDIADATPTAAEINVADGACAAFLADVLRCHNASLRDCLLQTRLALVGHAAVR
jgi:NAD(P)-dependent dehydrogenase (short-subunit alcohol dehydrogenase family)